MAFSWRRGGDEIFYGVYLLDNDNKTIEKARQSVPWHENGYKVIGSSTKTDTALEEILALKPTLVICDHIIMLGSSDTLMKTVKKAGIGCEFIMLTKYPTLTAMRDFFQSGGFDYLLKPLEAEQFDLALKRLSRKLNLKAAEV
jgi:response regulator of citrate/malate metabolism